MNIEEQISRRRYEIKYLEALSQQTIDIMNINIRAKEWDHVKTASENLIYFDTRMGEILREISELTQAQEKEALEVVT